MLIHLGINESGKALNDAHILSINQLKWHKYAIIFFSRKWKFKEKINKKKGLFIFRGKTKEDGVLSNQ